MGEYGFFGSGGSGGGGGSNGVIVLGAGYGSSVRCSNQNFAGALYSTLSGGACNASNGCFGTVSGGYCNTVNDTLSSTIGGGAYNTINDSSSVISGGYCNTVSGYRSTISGGYCNTINCGTSNTISGGFFNNICGCYNTLSGGYANSNSANYYGTLGGGYYNVVNFLGATVSGGQCNTSSAYRSTISGGYGNVSSGNDSFVGAGNFNISSGTESTITGGQCNINNGNFSNILGGCNNAMCGYANSNIIGSSITANRACTTFINDLTIASMVGCTSCTLCVDANGLVKTYSGSPSTTSYGLYTQTASSTPITATAVEGSLLDGGLGSLSIPANGFKIGDSFSAVLIGHLSCINTATLQIRIKTTSGILLADTGTMAMSATTSKHWKLDVNFTIRQIGAITVASIASGGLFAYTKNSGLNFEGVNFSIINNTTFDTTVLNTLVITAQWNTNDAGNSIYSEIFTLNKIY